MIRHVKIVAGLYIALGVLGVLAALLVFGIVGGLTEFPPARGDHESAIIILLGGIALLAIVTVSAPSIVAGIGLVKFQPWARVLAIILSVIHLFNLPFGTVLGIYSLWVMLQPQTQQLFHREQGQAAGAATSG